MKSNLRHTRNVLANFASLVAFKLASRGNSVRFQNQTTSSNTEFTGDIGIVVTTYESRQLSRAIPLIKQLRRGGITFPIVVVHNGNFSGNYNEELRRKFLSEISGIDGVFLASMRNFHGLAHNWNLGTRFLGCKKTLILNDDLWIDINTFASELHRILDSNSQADLILLNKSFSHFIISENCIKNVGWFDEHFLGIGEEDGDYFLRYRIEYKKNPVSEFTNSIVHFNDGDSSHENKGVAKYSLANLVYSQLKYRVNENGPGEFGEFRTPNMNTKFRLDIEDFRREFRLWETYDSDELSSKLREHMSLDDI